MRLLSVGYKTRLSDWGGYTLGLQELSSHVLPRLLAAGVGSRPVVFVTHSLGGLVVKQMLEDAATEPRYAARPLVSRVEEQRRRRRACSPQGDGCGCAAANTVCGL